MTIAYLYKYSDSVPFIDRTSYKGEIPFGVETWLIYCLSLFTKLIIIFATKYKEFDYYLDPSLSGFADGIAWGSNVFLLIIAITGVIYTFMVKCGSVSDHALHDIFRANETLIVLLDILDSLDLITFVFDDTVREGLWGGIEVTTIVVFFIPYILPSIQLAILRTDNWKYESIWARMGRFFQLMASVFFLQVPYIVLRIYVWATTGSSHDVYISPFFIKEFIFIYYATSEFFHRVYRLRSVEIEEDELE